MEKFVLIFICISFAVACSGNDDHSETVDTTNRAIAVQDGVHEIAIPFEYQDNGCVHTISCDVDKGRKCVFISEENLYFEIHDDLQANESPKMLESYENEYFRIIRAGDCRLELEVFRHDISEISVQRDIMEGCVIVFYGKNKVAAIDKVQLIIGIGVEDMEF